MKALPGPVDVVVAPGTVLIPDLVVIATADVGGPNIIRPPLLVVEVASPSTRRTDRTLKLATYEAAGVASYWLVDPDEPSLTVVELDGKTYGQPVTVTGEQRWTGTRPFPVEVVPAQLVQPAR